MQGGAPLEKGHFNWITEGGQMERWIVASCGNYTVLWNFRAVKGAGAETVSLGGLTTVSTYHMIAKSEHVVDSAFMHSKFARTPEAEAAVVVATNHNLWTPADNEDDE